MVVEKTVHVPVMMDQAIDALELREGMIVVDATLGGGGYTLLLSEIVGREGQVIALDADKSALERFEGIRGAAHNVTVVHSNYVHVRDVLSEMGISQVDAIVADLGLSSDQLAARERGFSFQGDGELDMRMDPTIGKSVKEYIDDVSEDDLISVLFEYGDEKHARKIARAIIEGRPYSGVQDLVRVIEGSVGGFYKQEKIHAATRTFQALRIAVNDEYKNLETFLTVGIELLRPNCRMSVVSFHSGEDRIVKRVFRSNARGCICPPELPLCVCSEESKVRLITRKPLLPDPEEVTSNPRSRSAKLRIVERCDFTVKQK